MTALINIAKKYRRSNLALRFAGMMLLMWNLQADASTITWNAAGGPAPAGSANWSTSGSWFNGTNTCTIGANSCTGVNYLGSAAPAVIVNGSHNPNAAGTSVDNISSLTFASMSIGAGYTVSSTGGAALTISGTLVNAGTINWLGTGFGLTLNGNTTNTGGTIGGIGTLKNNGTITGGTLTGTLTNTTGTVSGAKNSGTINGGALAGAITNTGTVSGTTINAGAVVTGGTVIGTTTNNGTITGGTIGTLATAGTVNGGTISGVTDATHGTLNNVLFTGASLTNGTVSGASTATGANTLFGTVTNTGTLTITSGTTTVAGGATLVTDSGIVDVNGGTLNIAAGGTIDAAFGFREDAGVVILNGTLDVSTANLLGGTFDGTGDFDAAVLNNSGVNLDVAGSAAANGGTAAIGTDEFGSFNQTAGGTLSLNFNGADTTNDEVLASAGVNLAGTLDLLNVSGVQLNLGSLLTNQDYVLVDDAGGAVAGTFGTVNVTGALNSANGAPGVAAGWWLVYNGADVTAGHGDVELDFVAATGVPEPGTDILLGCALVGLAVLRRKMVKR